MATTEAAYDASQPLIADIKISRTEHEEPDFVDELHDTMHSPSAAGRWRWFHTLTMLWDRTIVSFVYYCPLVFWLNYEADQGVTDWEFAVILICGEIGCVVAVFVADYIRNTFKSDENMMTTLFLPICALATGAYPAFAYFNSDQYVVGNVVYCSIMRFVIGLSFAFISAASLKFASDHADDATQITGIVAVLYFSWPASVALNIFAGYLITDNLWTMVFVYSGIGLIFSAFMSKLIFRCFPLRDIHREDAAIDSRELRADQLEVRRYGDLNEFDRRLMERQGDGAQSGLRAIFTDFNSVIIIMVSFFVTIRLCTMLIVFSSLWMEAVFEMAASSVGWTTLSCAGGEIVGLLMVRALSHRFELWVSAAGVLGHQWLFGAVLFVLAAIWGNDIPLPAALALIGLLWMGNATFRVIQKSNAIHYAPSPRLKFNLLLAQRMSEECASIVAIAVTMKLWKTLGISSILIWSIIWLGTTFMECFILFIYKDEPAGLRSGHLMSKSTAHLQSIQ